MAFQRPWRWEAQLHYLEAIGAKNDFSTGLGADSWSTLHLIMRKALFVFLCFFTAVAAQASYLPFFDGIRAAIVDRQVAISNAPPITPAGKKELNILKGALKTADKPSTTLATDLKNLSSIVLKVNKGASNETFAFEFRNAVSSWHWRTSMRKQI
jgi:hypothetical protein